MKPFKAPKKSQIPGDLDLLKKLKANPNDEKTLKQLLFYYLTNREEHVKAHDLAFRYRGNSVLEQSIEWHQCLRKVYETILAHDSSFLLPAVFNLDNYLTFLHRLRSGSSLEETVSVLRSFDTLLWKFCCSSNQSEHGSVMRDHFLGQLAYHIAVVLLRKSLEETSESSSKDEAISLSSLALLFAQKLGFTSDAFASAFSSFNSSPHKITQDKIKHDAKYRVIQANLTLRHWSSSTSKKEYVIRGQIYSLEIQKKIYYKIFPQTAVADSSCWLNAGVFKRLPTTLSSVDDILTETDLRSYVSFRLSIHDLVWLGVQLLMLDISDKINPILPAMFNFWDMAQMGNISFQSSVSGKRETLSSVDLDTFLYLTIFSCYYAAKDSTPYLLLGDAMPLLTTEGQRQFWSALGKLQEKKLDADSEKILMKGMETVRLTGQHGLDVELLIAVARTFMDHAENVLQPCFEADISSMKNRALLFWSHSLEQLKSFRRNEQCIDPENEFFPHRSKFSEMNPAEIDELIKEGHHFVLFENNLSADLDSRTSKHSLDEENIAGGDSSNCPSSSMIAKQDARSNCDTDETTLLSDRHAQYHEPQESMRRSEFEPHVNDINLADLAASQYQLVKTVEKISDKLESLEETVTSVFQLVTVIGKLADKVKRMESLVKVVDKLIDKVNSMETS